MVFSVLIESAECLECVRTSEIYGCGHWDPYRGHNMWARILRLELDPSACHALTNELYCTHEALKLEQHYVCGDKATNLYWNLTQVFLHSWCYQKNLFSASLAENEISTDFYILAMFVLIAHLVLFVSCAHL